jgi:hypothetical protein
MGMRVPQIIFGDMGMRMVLPINLPGLFPTTYPLPICIHLTIHIKFHATRPWSTSTFLWFLPLGHRCTVCRPHCSSQGKTLSSHLLWFRLCFRPSLPRTLMLPFALWWQILARWTTCLPIIWPSSIIRQVTTSVCGWATTPVLPFLVGVQL